MNVITYKNLLLELDKGNTCVIITKLNNNIASQNKLLYTDGNLSKFNCKSDLDKLLYQKSKYALETGNLQFVKESDDETYLIEPYFPEPRLIILGGGHIAKPLAEFASKTGFSVTVIDDRPSFANSERFPTARKVICESFDNCFDFINLNKSAYVVIVTRGHRHDMDCLREVLKHDTAYVGMIGSKRRVKIVMQQMLDDGYSKEKLNTVNAPIGLKIGAITPDEIALSIISQVISYRRLGNITTSASNPIKTNWPEFDHDVLNELCKEEISPRALITIVSTKGSVPRNAGAKMIVWPFGKILGSIGGGCSEGEIINTARDLIKKGGYKLQNIDMTGTIAEDEGMVCGGIMNVIIETF